MEHQKTGNIEMAALKAGMTRKTAAKHLHAGELPSEQVKERDWRTRADPFDADWPEAKAMLQAAPELESKALFEWLGEQHPDHYQEGQVRTFQRRVRRWRAMEGPEKEVYFQQEHPPGVRLSTDFTCLNELEITIRGEPFEHRVCHSVLSYSNWQWGTVAHSESLLALRKGVQATLLQLGHTPTEHWTDHSTAATHELGEDEQGRRGFNRGYLELMDHFGIVPRTINRQEPHENGDVESANGVLKRRLKQHLLLRGGRDFNDLDSYRRFLESVFMKANRGRQARLAEELAIMRPLRVALLPEYMEEQVHVSRWSTILSDRCVYSVPSRLIGETVRVFRYEEHVEVHLGGALQVRMPRLTGDCTHAINYRHVIEWLIRKPGAFAEYRFHQDLFPTLAFRRAYDQLREACTPRTADLEYLRILRQAARTMECEVDAVLLELARRGLTPRWATVMEFLPVPAEASLPELKPLSAQLADYDQLLGETEVRS